MLLFAFSTIIFNVVAYKMKKPRISKNQIVHIWAFTVVCLTWADIVIDEKTGGYWYFDKGIEWHNFLVYTVLIPPVNVIFLNWFPCAVSWLKRFGYYISWIIFITIYELIALLRPPIGFFHYGWWKLPYSIILDPFLLLSLRVYYKWICKIEKSD